MLDLRLDERTACVGSFSARALAMAWRKTAPMVGWVSGSWVSAEYPQKHPQFGRLQAHGNTHERTLADAISFVFACFSDTYGRKWTSEEGKVVRGRDPNSFHNILINNI